MAVAKTYYIDTNDLATATAIYLDKNMSIAAPNGIYSNGVIYRILTDSSLSAGVAVPECPNDVPTPVEDQRLSGVFNFTNSSENNITVERVWFVLPSTIEILSTQSNVVITGTGAPPPNPPGTGILNVNEYSPLSVFLNSGDILALWVAFSGNISSLLIEYTDTLVPSELVLSNTFVGYDLANDRTVIQRDYTVQNTVAINTVFALTGNVTINQPL